MSSENSGLIDELEELRLDAKFGKDKHFAAADRKSNYHIWLGLPMILINVAVGGSLLGTLAREDTLAPWVSALAITFAAIAAFLGAIQTFFQFESNAARHRSIANRYLAVSRDCKTLVRRYRDGQLDAKQVWDRYTEFIKEYHQINKESESSPTSKHDFNKAAEKRKPVTPFALSGKVHDGDGKADPK